MFTSISASLTCAKIAVDGWFRRVFKEQAGGAEVIATLIIIAIVLSLALIFKDKLGELVKTLWNSMIKDGNVSDPTIPEW